jgi:hypothetical protein
MTVLMPGKNIPDAGNVFLQQQHTTGQATNMMLSLSRIPTVSDETEKTENATARSQATWSTLRTWAE